MYDLLIIVVSLQMKRGGMAAPRMVKNVGTFAYDANTTFTVYG